MWWSYVYIYDTFTSSVTVDAHWRRRDRATAIQLHHPHRRRQKSKIKTQAKIHVPCVGRSVMVGMVSDHIINNDDGLCTYWYTSMRVRQLYTWPGRDAATGPRTRGERERASHCGARAVGGTRSEDDARGRRTRGGYSFVRAT